ncbi:MAG: Na(+)-translocating NADH-quinone reductase subunit A [Bacteroidota bacterium]
MPSTRVFTGLVLLVALLGQSQAATGGMSNILLYSLGALAVILFFFFLTSVADNLMVIESRQMGVDDKRTNLGLFPRISELFGKRKPSYLDNTHLYELKRGFDLPFEGAADAGQQKTATVSRFAVQPPNFIGLQPIPKMLVEVGDSVKAGDPIFFDKKMDQIKFAAPVSGEIIEVKRGAKRAITEVIILADKDQESRSYDVPALTAGRQTLVDFLLESGAWPFILQRPYNVVADPAVSPRDIFVSTFDSGPMGADLSLAAQGRGAAFQKGIDVLNKLTDGIVYLGLDGRGEQAPSTVFTGVAGAEQRYFRGKHPAGNVGVQIHHIHPIGNHDKVWTLDVNGVLLIGELFLSGKFDTSRPVALTGAPLNTPHYVTAPVGANIGELLAGQLDSTEGQRIISGNVLTGQQKTTDDFLDAFSNQLSVLAEGDSAELFGWLLPLRARPSISPTIPNLAGQMEATTNTHGEPRAFVVTNDYETVMPMDIYTQQLMKAIMVNDFEGMEGLGIYELVEEDVALAEFACVSKQPLQQILRKGLDTMREQS